MVSLVDKLKKDPSLKHSEITPTLSLAGLLKSSRAKDRALSGEIQTDSRLAGKDDIYVCYKGVTLDGHDFLKAAYLGGVRAFVIDQENLRDSLPEDADCHLVTSGRAAWAALCAAAAGNPQQKMKMLGVTGTNGKTSVVWMARHILNVYSHKTSALGTLGAWCGPTDFVPTSLTTPDPPFFFQFLAHSLASGIDTCVMEVSSHAIAMQKLFGVRFLAAGFTSFSRDHLDYHSSLDEYLATKFAFISDMLAGPKPRRVLHNSIPLSPEQIKQFSRDELLIYGASDKFSDIAMRHQSQLVGVIHESNISGTRFHVESASAKSPPLHFGLVGDFAVNNFLCAGALVETIIGEPLDWQRAAKAIKPIPGRLEPVFVAADNRPRVFVDYAHTPDALQKSLAILRPLTAGRLIVVFGCGGNRDAGKRPVMGRVAESFADAVALTSDNPRHEDPLTIIEQILTGVKNRGKIILMDPDREGAIAKTLAGCDGRDTVLIAGKGHEDYMIIGDTKHHFDDREVARKYLSQVDG